MQCGFEYIESESGLREGFQQTVNIVPQKWGRKDFISVQAWSVKEEVSVILNVSHEFLSLSASPALAAGSPAGFISGLQAFLCIPTLRWEYGLQCLQSEGLIHSEHNDPVFTHTVWLALYSASIYFIHNALSPICLALMNLCGSVFPQCTGINRRR